MARQTSIMSWKHYTWIPEAICHPEFPGVVVRKGNGPVYKSLWRTVNLFYTCTTLSFLTFISFGALMYIFLSSAVFQTMKAFVTSLTWKENRLVTSSGSNRRSEIRFIVGGAVKRPWYMLLYAVIHYSYSRKCDVKVYTLLIPFLEQFWNNRTPSVFWFLTFGSRRKICYQEKCLVIPGSLWRLSPTLSADGSALWSGSTVCCGFCYFGRHCCHRQATLSLFHSHSIFAHSIVRKLIFSHSIVQRLPHDLSIAPACIQFIHHSLDILTHHIQVETERAFAFLDNLPYYDPSLYCW